MRVFVIVALLKINDYLAYSQLKLFCFHRANKSSISRISSLRYGWFIYIFLVLVFYGLGITFKSRGWAISSLVGSLLGKWLQGKREETGSKQKAKRNQVEHTLELITSGGNNFPPTEAFREAAQNAYQTWATEGWEVQAAMKLTLASFFTIVPWDINSVSPVLVHIWLQWIPAWLPNQNISGSFMTKSKGTV